MGIAFFNFEATGFNFMRYFLANEFIKRLLSGFSVNDLAKISIVFKPRLDNEAATFPDPPIESAFDIDFTIGAGPSGDNLIALKYLYLSIIKSPITIISFFIELNFNTNSFLKLILIVEY